MCAFVCATDLNKAGLRYTKKTPSNLMIKGRSRKQKKSVRVHFHVSLLHFPNYYNFTTYGKVYAVRVYIMLAIRLLLTCTVVSLSLPALC